MIYLNAKAIDSVNDKELIYVNRNIFNATIAEYEIKIEDLDCKKELEFMLKLWKKIYEGEMKNKRVEPFVKMTAKEIKLCFKNYKKLPKGTFAQPQE